MLPTAAAQTLESPYVDFVLTSRPRSELTIDSDADTPADTRHCAPDCRDRSRRGRPVRGLRRGRCDRTPPRVVAPDHNDNDNAAPESQALHQAKGEAGSVLAHVDDERAEFGSKPVRCRGYVRTRGVGRPVRASASQCTVVVTAAALDCCASRRTVPTMPARIAERRGPTRGRPAHRRSAEFIGTGADYLEGEPRPLSHLCEIRIGACAVFDSMPSSLSPSSDRTPDVGCRRASRRHLRRDGVRERSASTKVRPVADLVDDPTMLTPGRPSRTLHVSPKTVTRRAREGRLSAAVTPGGGLGAIAVDGGADHGFDVFGIESERLADVNRPNL